MAEHTINDTLDTQQNNTQREIHYSYNAGFIEEAEDLFIEVKELLFDVNNWNKTVNLNTLSCKLTDHHQKEVHRAAHKNDYIKVTNKDQVINWLYIDAIEYDDYPDESKESFSLSIIPVLKTNELLQNCLILTIERMGTQLIASYHFNKTAHLNTFDEQPLHTGTQSDIFAFATEVCDKLLKSLVKFD